ncbi:hypothetical protein I3843_07G037500 [Carya illinoinensis]|uniref:F-box domain-containing protein n=1 Tax=Carya illinoinensis TaxID=32201 RepID=A0A8T1PQT8_CARIL|nr:F-box/kelch-repeat protein At3g06240-like [Carya illinoinensis]KAG2695979.1 hypothetical protein I3760_07G037000 [Carya illinoinensis]KAG6646869.1 hypothetical protein CIPAW_07G037900 [Carya illinoinensis]KAG6702518.1 hypothetical protein I3842_07G037900 [Carya illinoinensis]KAG7969576.1 hypothetical protein I3843_07G037500 [Carya illinoinensis]
MKAAMPLRRKKAAMLRTRKNLPEDLILEILLRLPVKSLVRFRCVSKRWLFLISDPHFAKSHFDRASEHTQRLLLSTPLRFGSLETDAPLWDGSAVRELFFPFKQEGRAFKIVGSCNGLVCVSLSQNEGFYIWNPSTGSRRKLPDPPETPPDREIRVHGFGYDSSAEDYKVVLGLFPSYEGRVFSSKRNSWKTIEDFFFDFNDSAGIFCNGTLHWEVLLEDYTETIAAFDLAEEEFWEVPMPQQYDDHHEEIIFYSLMNLGGRLCLTCRWCYSSTHFEIWVMQEYGVQESWAPMFEVRHSDLINCRCSLIPLCFPRAEKLEAIYMGKELIRTDHDGAILERFMLSSDIASCEAAVFFESLLSPN